MLEFLSIEIIPSSIIHPLSKQLNGRLSPIFFFLRHIKIINENDDFVFTLFRPKVTFSSSGTNFGVNQSLNLICNSLPRKRGGQESVFLIIIINIELIGNIDGFTCTRRSTE